MTSLCWLLMPEGAVPAGDDWLAPKERARLAGLRFERRRRDWRLGRWTARSALRRCPRSWLGGAAPAELSVLPDTDGAPHVVPPCGDEPCVLSLSHRAGACLCVVAPGGTRVGCDLERVEARSRAFVRDYLTHPEQRLVEQAAAAERDAVANLVWSAKESAVKVLGTGWRVDTRSVEVRELGSRDAGGWHGLRVHCDDSSRTLSGWWRREGEKLLTVLAAPSPRPPTSLGVGAPGR